VTRDQPVRLRGGPIDEYLGQCSHYYGGHGHFSPR
jgi:hypothetical protein